MQRQKKLRNRIFHICRNITKENDESESDATAKTSSSSKPKFSFLVSPSSTRIAICSGFGICLFTLPENILRQVTCICLVIHNKNEMISLYNISFLNSSFMTKQKSNNRTNL